MPRKPRPLTEEEIEAAADRAEGKKPDASQAQTGRPPKYQASFAEQAAKLCKLGATNDDLADFFEVKVRTIYRWLTTHPEFAAAMTVGKEAADARVERSLFHRAVGYEQEAVKIFMPAGATAPVYAPYVEKVAPDTTAAIFWLKNRKPEEWRDRYQNEHTGKDGAPIEVAQAKPRDVAKALALILAKGVRDKARGSVA